MNIRWRRNSSAVAVFFVLSAMLPAAAEAEEDEPGFAPGTGFVQTTFFDLEGTSGLTDHADPQGLIRTPWAIQQQESGLGNWFMDILRQAQVLRIRSNSTAIGDLRITRTFDAQKNQRYAGSATVQFSNVANPTLLRGRVVIVGIDPFGNQVGGTGGECNVEQNPSDLDPAGQELPLQVLQINNCVLPNDDAVDRVRFKVGLKSFESGAGRGSGEMTIHEVSFHFLGPNPAPT